MARPERGAAVVAREGGHGRRGVERCWTTRRRLPISRLGVAQGVPRLFPKPVPSEGRRPPYYGLNPMLTGQSLPVCLSNITCCRDTGQEQCALILFDEERFCGQENDERKSIQRNGENQNQRTTSCTRVNAGCHRGELGISVEREDKIHLDMMPAQRERGGRPAAGKERKKGKGAGW